MDTEYINIVKESYKSPSISPKELNSSLPINKKGSNSNEILLRELHCAVLGNVHTLLAQIDANPFDSVRGIFMEGDELYNGAGFKDKTHIQICIRNPNCIKGFFLPRKEIKWPIDTR